MPDYTKLIQISKNLNQLRDELTRELLQFEEYINSTNVGVEAKVPISPDCYFSFGKSVGGKWGLYILKTLADGTNHWWQIKDAPTALKVEAFNNINELLVEIIATAEQLTADMIRATITAKEIVVAIEKAAAEIDSQNK